ncbi:MAG: ADOP family duplicated permease [Bryobacteraceae bacterium]|jgi:predicted permease
MAFWNEIGNRLAYLFRRSRFDRELEEEVRFHIQARADELEQAGLSGADALLRARREFGSTLRTREETRSAWQIRWLEDLGSDLRYAARALRRNLALTLAAVGSLALGIGANTTIFSVAREALFSEPSCRDPKSLVQISVSGNSWVPMSQYRFLEETHAFDGLAGMNIQMVVNWRDGNRSYRLAGTRVTDNFFEVVGIPVAMGRSIERGESDVAVITNGFWTKRLGGDPNVVGRKLALDGKPYTVIGVLPRDHRMLAGFGFTPDLYLTKDPIEVMLYARLPQGMGRQAAYTRLKPICRELDRVYPDVNRKWAEAIRLSTAGGVERLQEEGQAAIPAVAFFGMLVVVTAIVVLIACANVSSLLLARAFTRSREFAIRMSLGGSRGRLVRQLLAESLLLALLGTGAGLLLNFWLTRLLSGFHIPTPLPIELLIQPDRMLLAYSVAIAFVVTLATGLVPALKGTRAGIGGALKEGGRQAGPAGYTLRNALVIGQLAVSIILLSAGLLFVRNLMYTTSFNAGFDTSRTVVATFGTVPGSYTPQKFAALVDTALERLRALPGIEAASPASAVPLNPFLAFSRASGPLRPDGGSRTVRVQYNSNTVGPDYFRIMGIPIQQGRSFLDSDRVGAPEVVILNENLARRLFGNANPVGHILRFPNNRDARVVGIARNSKYVTLGEENAMALYAPHAQQRYAAFAHFFVRTRSAPETMVRKVDETLAGLDAAAAVETRVMGDVFAGALLPSRVGAAVLGSMALFGLMLASIGLYGVLLYATHQRIREIGIRVALGATPGNVLAMVVGQSLRLVTAGMVMGLAVAAVAVRPLSMFLAPEVRPADPMNFVAVACVLALVAGLATVAPTARALRVDPAVALRHE